MYAVVSFLSGGEYFAADADAVLSVVAVGDMLAGAAGDSDDGGPVREASSGTLLVDLAALLGQGATHPTRDARLLLLREEERSVAFLVDEVREFKIIEGAELLPDEAGDAASGAPARRCMYKGEVLQVLDLQSMAADIVAARGGAMSAAGAARRTHRNTTPSQ